MCLCIHRHRRRRRRVRDRVRDRHRDRDLDRGRDLGWRRRRRRRCRRIALFLVSPNGMYSRSCEGHCARKASSEPQMVSSTQLHSGNALGDLSSIVPMALVVIADPTQQKQQVAT